MVKKKATPSTGKIILLSIFGMLLVGMVVIFFIQKNQPVDYKKYQDIAKNNDLYLIENQAEIMAEIRNDGINPIDLGHLFIPDFPAQYVDINEIPQYNVPYLSQNDPRWSQVKYGTDGSRAIWENGCAVVSLAMVEGYFSGRLVAPQEIVAWTGNNFYVHEQGSSWTLYPAFAEDFGYDYVDIGNDFHEAMYLLNQGYLIIVAVGPGQFTNWGHVMVIRGYDGNMVYINDPNDSPEKFFSIQGIPSQIIIEEGMNYWAFRK